MTPGAKHSTPVTTSSKARPFVFLWVSDGSQDNSRSAHRCEGVRWGEAWVNKSYHSTARNHGAHGVNDGYDGE